MKDARQGKTRYFPNFKFDVIPSAFSQAVRLGIEPNTRPYGKRAVAKTLTKYCYRQLTVADLLPHMVDESLPRK